MPSSFSVKGILELTAELALAGRRLRGPFLGGMRAIPRPVFHRSAVGLARLEHRVRHPLASAKSRREARHAFSLLDGDGRHGLTRGAAARSWDYASYVWTADMGTLLLHLPDAGFRAKALEIENGEAIDDARASGQGAIVAGLHLGPHASLPLILAQSGYQVAVIGSSAVLDLARRFAEPCLPEAWSRIVWFSTDEPRLLLKARSALRRGALLVGFVDQPASEPAWETEVGFLGGTVGVSRALPYLAAVTGCSIVPACLTRAAGPRFALRLDDALPAPARDAASVEAVTQMLIHWAERQILAHPDQWIGWRMLAPATGRRAVELAPTGQSGTRGALPRFASG